MTEILSICGCGVVGSASPSQGEGRGFEPRHPLHKNSCNAKFADVAQLVEHSLRKGQVVGSTPTIGSK